MMRTGQVFVSHTSDMTQFPEGRSFVQAALDAVGRAGMAPVDMRYFAARDGRPADYCRQRVRGCEISVTLAGFRYGSLVPGEAVSYTELEFQAATQAGLSRLVFLLEEGACPPPVADADRRLAEGFRERLRDAGLVVRSFSSAEGLELEVFHALSELSSGKTIPRIWNLPNRNADFTGRGAILEKLHDELAADGKAVVLARALYGLGGVGKTQVALEYAHRYQADYELLWWIPAEQPQGISLALADLAERLGFQASDSAAEAAKVALERLRSHAGRWLLIFDNAEEPAELEDYLPAASRHGHVIVTSRNHAWSHRAEPLEVDIFRREESVTHLLRHVHGLRPNDAATISAAVGDLPLAIEQAAAWLADTGMPAALYTQQLATQAASALGLNKPPDYALPVAATWNLSLARLRERSLAAVRLLQILAFCSPEQISMDLLYSDEMNESLRPFDETLGEKFMLGRVIAEISRLALVKVDHGSNSLQIHRLVQAVIRSQMTEEERQETRHEVHKILVGARPREGETDDPANWPTYDIIWPHLEPSRAEQCGQESTRQLLVDWVRYQWKRGEFESALSQANPLQALWTQQLGPDHQQTLHLQFQIANVLRSLGRFSEARDLDTDVLERQRAVLGVNHPDALRTAGGLGGDLRALGEYEQALSVSRDTYERWKSHFGRDHVWTLAAAHNMASSLRLVGDYVAARGLDQETLDREQRALPRDHPNVLLSQASLALDMRAAGESRESVDVLRDTLARYQGVLGEDTLETLRTAASLAVSLRKAGEQSEAMILAQDTYERYLRRYDPDLLDALACALNLACSYAAADNMPRALDLVTDVKATLQATLGDDHPHTLAAANNLAIYLRRTGRLVRARRLAEQTLLQMRTRLGDGHPYSLSCATNLANCLADAADLPQAEVLQRETLRVLNAKLGPRHPDTLAGEANLAVTLHQAGRDHEAEQARTSIMDGLREILGPDQPDLRLIRDWQRLDRDLELPPF
jgi:Domain of unknown function (DUF4062)/Tetratricopeptide repeat/NB-ARC domain